MRTMLAALALVLGGCSSSPHAIATFTRGFRSPASTLASSATVAPAQRYLDQVNALCDALLPKVLAAMHGGHDSTYPVRTYFAEEPAHQRARDGFDADLATVAVPAEAATQHAALANYLRFANRIDAARDKAAHAGQAAFDRQTTHERTVDANSPIISALEAAGFHESCTAR